MRAYRHAPQARGGKGRAHLLSPARVKPAGDIGRADKIQHGRVITLILAQISVQIDAARGKGHKWHLSLQAHAAPDAVTLQPFAANCTRPRAIAGRQRPFAAAQPPPPPPHAG